MDVWSISQISRFSGVKSHTIRIWEQRYNALRPGRSKGNTRRYDGSQLRRLLNIAGLMESGHKISELAGLTDQELFELIENKQNDPVPNILNLYISQLVSAGLNYDEAAFEKVFLHCILRYGFKDTYIEIICPLLERLGLMWSTGTLPTANEHFISNLIRQKLCVSIDAIPPGNQESNSWLLFLPENEFHEIGLLMANYMLRLSGKKTIYLGANAPLDSVYQAIEDTEVKNLLIFLIHNEDQESVQDYFNGLQEKASGQEIYVAGNKNLLELLDNKKKAVTISSVEDLDKKLVQKNN